MGRTRDGFALDRHLVNNTDTPPIPVATFPMTVIASFQWPDISPSEQGISNLVLFMEDTKEYQKLGSFSTAGLDVTAQISSRAGGAPAVVATSQPFDALGVWHHGSGRVASANSRSVWLDRLQKDTDTGSKSPNAPDSTSLLRLPDDSGWIAYIQRTIVWDEGLSDEEIVMMSHNRVSPFALRSRIPKAYWPLHGGTGIAHDLVGPVDLTPAAGGVGEIGGPVYRGPRVID